MVISTLSKKSYQDAGTTFEEVSGQLNAAATAIAAADTDTGDFVEAQGFDAAFDEVRTRHEQSLQALALACGDVARALDKAGTLFKSVEDKNLATNEALEGLMDKATKSLDTAEDVAAGDAEFKPPKPKK